MSDLESSNVDVTPDSDVPVFVEQKLNFTNPANPAMIHLETFIADGIQMSASDLFVSMRQKDVALAARRMGLVRQCGSLPRETGMRLIGHLKAAAGMDLTRSPMPQDGRLTVEIGSGKYVDVRLSVVPTLFGEDLTMRLLDREKQLVSVDDLGFHKANLKNLAALLHKPGGLIMVTGPVDMGKTTTLYACLQYLNDGTKKIHTLEDPIEYTLDGIHQSQVNLKRGVDFPVLLRGILRQSPDIIMVGEVRDIATAEIVVRAANSGLLVFATAHATTTAGACQNLIVLGVQPHFIATSLLGVVTQRLVRKLCPHCKMPIDMSMLDDIAEETDATTSSPPPARTPYMPVGCPKCLNTGYIGRIAVGEVLRTSPEIRRMVQKGATSSEIHRVAIEHGMIEMCADAQDKIDRGITSPDEVMRVIPAAYAGLAADEGPTFV